MIIYLGLPMYGGAHGLTVSCLLSLQKHLMLSGHEVVTDIVATASILTKARNGIVKRFIDSGADVLLFIDSDMVFEPKSVEKIIDAPFDVSVISYRTKHNTVKFLAEAKRQEGQAVGTIIDGETWLQTDRAGTGMMAIKRRTIEQMTAKYPELVYAGEDGLTPCLFDFQLQDGQYYGEDYTFCKRLTAIGGQIFILVNASIGHIGSTVYEGNYHEFLKGQS